MSRSDKRYIASRSASLEDVLSRICTEDVPHDGNSPIPIYFNKRLCHGGSLLTIMKQGVYWLLKIDATYYVISTCDSDTRDFLMEVQKCMIPRPDLYSKSLNGDNCSNHIFT